MSLQDDEYICVDREHGLWKRKEPKENVNADRLALALALETIRELERENNELHAEIANLNSLLLEAKRCFSHEFMAELHSECNMLGRENAALRADKERLDFLGQTKCAYYYEGPCCWRINEDKDTDGDTLRDAIDAARKEAQP